MQSVRRQNRQPAARLKDMRAIRPSGHPTQSPILIGSATKILHLTDLLRTEPNLPASLFGDTRQEFQ